MSATGRQLISRALIEVGVLAAGEVPTSAEEADAHIIAKRMVNSLGTEKLAIHRILRTALTLTSGTRDYSIGPGGALNIARPLWIDHAGCILDTAATDPLEVDIDVLTEQRWSQVRLKTFDGAPLSAIYYDRRFDSSNRGLISTYPTINNSTHQLVLYTPEAVTGFDSLTTQYVHPPGYEEAFHFELAYQLCGPFSVPEPTRQRVKEMRTEAWARVKRSNFNPSELRLDRAVSGQGGGWSRSQFNTGGLA